MTPSLHAVTVSELRAQLTQAELEAIPDAVDGVEAEAWLAAHIEHACARVVGAINACEKNARIAPGGSKVPLECVRTVLVLARHAVIAAVPGLASTLEGESRAAEYATATRDLDRLAACELLPLYELEDEEAADSGVSVAVSARPFDDWFL